MESFTTPPKFSYIHPGFGNVQLPQLSPGTGLSSSNVRPQLPTSKRAGTPISDFSSPDCDNSRAASPASASCHNPGTEYQPQTCQCQRPVQLVMCCSCGFTCRGRIRKPCSLHPTSVYLMDMDSCPECNSQRIQEFKPSTKE